MKTQSVTVSVTANGDRGLMIMQINNGRVYEVPVIVSSVDQRNDRMGRRYVTIELEIVGE